MSTQCTGSTSCLPGGLLQESLVCSLCLTGQGKELVYYYDDYRTWGSSTEIFLFKSIIKCLGCVSGVLDVLLHHLRELYRKFLFKSIFG